MHRFIRVDRPRRTTASPALLVGLLLAFAVLLGATACGSSDGGGSTSGAASEGGSGTIPDWVGRAASEPTPTPTPPPPPPPYDGEIVRLSVPRLGIDHRIERVGILPSGEMDTPKAANTRIGWYYDFPKPGFGLNSIFSAHETYDYANGPFKNLYLARAGDELTVEMDNGLRYQYVVFSNRRYPVTTMPIQAIIEAPERPRGEEWITLITCGGRFVATSANGLGEYLDRDVVVAKRVG